MAIQRISLMAAVCAFVVMPAFAQTPPLVFTAAAPVRADAGSTVTIRAFPVIEERGLALWGGTASDFGAGVEAVGRRWTVRSVTSLTIVPVGRNLRPTFQQVEMLRPLFATASTSMVAGGGVRQEWDGTRVLLGRAVLGTDLGRGRLQGSFVLERAEASPIRRDAADVVTTAGWSTRINDRIAVGVEGIGQDLEGFWDRTEADGGAKLLIGPSIQVRSTSGAWSATATVGPVFRSPAGADPFSADRPDGRHFAIFASGSWRPSSR